MEPRGRKSADAVIATAQVVHLPGKWPEPPAELTETQAQAWRAIVATKPHDWFGPDTYPLLMEYVRAIQSARVIAEAIERFDPACLLQEDGLDLFERLNRMQDAKSGTLARLATKMRLAQQSRYDKQAANGKAKSAGSPGLKPWERPRQ